MSNKTPSQLLLANSTSIYGIMLRPYFSDYCPYATLPAQPRSSHQLPPWPRRSTATPAGAASATNSSKSSLSHSSSLRAFNFNVNPLWRHTNPSHHLHHHHQHHHQHQHHHHHHKLPHRAADISASSHSKLRHDLLAATESRCKCAPSLLDKDFRPRTAALIMQRSLPIFEVLPPLTTDNAGSQTANYELLYENEYVLDGVKYDWNSANTPHTGKLKLDYFKFLKSITAKSKPSDRDVIFGNAKVLFKRPCGWERSRIEWLFELERRQELRNMMRRSRRKRRQKENANNNNNIKLETTADGVQNGVKLLDDEFEEDEDSLLGDWCFPWGKKTLNTLMLHFD